VEEKKKKIIVKRKGMMDKIEVKLIEFKNIVIKG
jgi:hypothetical protein